MIKNLVIFMTAFGVYALDGQAATTISTTLTLTSPSALISMTGISSTANFMFVSATNISVTNLSVGNTAISGTLQTKAAVAFNGTLATPITISGSLGGISGTTVAKPAPGYYVINLKPGTCNSTPLYLSGIAILPAGDELSLNPVGVPTTTSVTVSTKISGAGCCSDAGVVNMTVLCN